MAQRTFRTAVLAATLAFREASLPPGARTLARRVGRRILRALDARRARRDARDSGVPGRDD